MQVERDVLEQPAELADLLKAPLEKALIVGLEAQIALLPQDLIIDLQIRAPGQTALALAVGRPRIREVQVDAVDLGRSEYLAQLGRVEGDEAQIGSGCCSQRSAAMMSAPSSRSTAIKFTSG